MNAFAAKLASLLGSASVFTIAQAIPAQAQQTAQNAQQVAQAETAQAEEIPENDLITGSLIREAAAVGVPVTNLNPRDLNLGALTTTDLFRTVPSAIVQAGTVATANPGNIEKATQVGPLEPAHRSAARIAFWRLATSAQSLPDITRTLLSNWSA